MVTPPPNLNQTEYLAWEWLTGEKDYGAGDIQRDSPQQSPDFICPDESYEVKRIYPADTLVFTENQVSSFQADDPLIVVMSEDNPEPLDTFRWSEREGTDYNIRGPYRDTAKLERITIHCPPELKADWEHFKTLNAEDNPDALRKLLRLADENPELLGGYFE